MTETTAPLSIEEYGKAMNGFQKALAYSGQFLMYIGVFRLIGLQAWPQLIGLIPLWFLVTKFFGIPQVIALLRTRKHARVTGLKRKLLIQIVWLSLIYLILLNTGYLGYGMGAFFILGSITSGFSMPMNYLLADVKK